MADVYPRPGTDVTEPPPPDRRPMGDPTQPDRDFAKVGIVVALVAATLFAGVLLALTV